MITHFEHVLPFGLRHTQAEVRCPDHVEIVVVEGKRLQTVATADSRGQDQVTRDVQIKAFTHISPFTQCTRPAMSAVLASRLIFGWTSYKSIPITMESYSSVEEGF